MCVALSVFPSVYLRGKFQENKSTFGPDSFWRKLVLFLGTWGKQQQKQSVARSGEGEC